MMPLHWLGITHELSRANPSLHPGFKTYTSPYLTNDSALRLSTNSELQFLNPATTYYS